ncbi:hypothetical protein Aduo_009494 [Ancylostoma duodenale]
MCCASLFKYEAIPCMPFTIVELLLQFIELHFRVRTLRPQPSDMIEEVSTERSNLVASIQVAEEIGPIIDEMAA